MSEQRTDGVGADPTAQPEGVGKQPTAQPEGVGAETTEPTAGGAEPQPKGEARVNLDDLPQFRDWKSAYDKRMADVQRQAQEARRQADQLASELDELRMRDMPLDEREAYYRTKLAEERAQSAAQREQFEERQRYISEAAEALAELGLEPDTPGLEWGEGPSSENMVNLLRSAARIVAERNRQASQQAHTQTEEQVREARVAALNAAGVTRTSVATTGAPPESNPIADIKDPNELLRMGTESALKRAEGRQPPRG